MMGNESIIYINYSPYENSGHILDFLTENFKYVFLFSIGFHDLKRKQKHNRLIIYKSGKIIHQEDLFQIPIPSSFIYLLLPARSFVTLIEVIWYSFALSKKYGKINKFFTVNGFTSWVGIALRKLGLVKETIFWVWDYYPLTHANKMIQLMRQIYWQFDKTGSLSNRVSFVNRRILILHRQKGTFPKKVKYPIVPIGIKPIKNLLLKNKKYVTLGFIGVIKRSQGLDIVFDNSKLLVRKYPTAKFEVVGSGPDEDYFKNKAKGSLIKTNFHGYIDGEKFYEVLGKCSIGIATYIPNESNVSHFGDPGKVKRYLTLGIPVIMTNVFEFSKEVEDFGAGVIIRYNHPEDFLKAVDKIMKNYKSYQLKALKLSQKFDYKKIYPVMFTSSKK